MNICSHYELIKNKIKPLDLFLFKGSSIYSKFIQINSRLVTGSGEWSHCGIVITKEILDIPEIKPDKLYIWESVSSSKTHQPANIYGKHFIGSQIRELDIVIKEYCKNPNNNVAWCELQDNRRKLLKMDKIKKIFKTLFYKYDHHFYDINCCTLLGAMFSCFRCCTSKFDKLTENWLFCSELVALVYIDLQIFPQSVDPKYVIPVDFIGYDSDHAVPVVVNPPVKIII